MPGRNVSSNAYRYGFQNQEVDNEWLGGAVVFKYRIYDARLGRFFSVDPLTSKYAHNSPYAFSENKVIHCIELEGKESMEYVLRMLQAEFDSFLSNSWFGETLEKVGDNSYAITPEAKKNSEYFMTTLIISGGIIAIVATGGVAATGILATEGMTLLGATSAGFAITSGSMAGAGGTAKLVLQ